MKFIKYLSERSWEKIKVLSVELFLLMLYFVFMVGSALGILFGPPYIISLFVKTSFKDIGGYYVLTLCAIAIIWLICLLVYTFIKWLIKVRKDFKNGY